MRCLAFATFGVYLELGQIKCRTITPCPVMCGDNEGICVWYVERDIYRVGAEAEVLAFICNIDTRIWI